MPGIYLGTGSIKTVSSIYVGAGGVKTVSAVYVGIGGTPKLVWPSWSNGDDLFDPTTESWYWWRCDGSNSHVWTAQTNKVQGTSNYVYFSWDFGSGSSSESSSTKPTAGDGVYIASTTQLNFSSIKYIVIGCQPYTTLNSNGTSHYIYVSVNSDRTTLPSNDSGNNNVYVRGYDPEGNSNSGIRYIIVNMTNCNRTGSLKIRDYWNLGTLSYSWDSAQFRLYSIRVYDSYPSISSDWLYDLTVT